MTINELQW